MTKQINSKKERLKELQEDFRPSIEKNIKTIELPENIFQMTKGEAEQHGIQVATAKALNKDSKFAIRLRDLRERAKLTQQEVAKCVGVTKSAIGYYENGESVPDAKILYKLSVLFDVSVDYLLLKVNIKTPDLGVRKISEITGLSERVVKIISGRSAYIGSDLKVARKFLNCLFEDFSIWDSFSYLENIMSVEASVREEKKEEYGGYSFDAYTDRYEPGQTVLSAGQYKEFMISILKDEWSTFLINAIKEYLLKEVPCEDER